MNIAVLGTLAKKQASGPWLEGYDYRKSFTYSRASGAVENYQVKLVIAEPAGGPLFSDCEATTGWAASNNPVSTDTGCVGTYCLKFTGGDRGGGDPYYVVKYLSPHQNWVAAGYKTMTLWHKCSDGATTFQVRITSNGTNRWNITSGSDWAKTTIDLTSPDSGTGPLDNVEAVAIENVAGTTVYWDEMRLQTDADCEGHCLSTFNDLRFTNSDGNELDYWIESISGTTPNQVATVWVELDSVGTSATTFYMFYGKADASAASNGANTFIKFEDAEWGSHDTALATSGGSITWTTAVEGAVISTDQAYTGTRSIELPYSGSASEATFDLTPSANISIQYRIYKNDANDIHPFYHGNGSKRVCLHAQVDEDLTYYKVTTETDTGYNLTADTWQQIEVNNFDWTNYKFDLWLNGVQIGSSLDMQTSIYAGDVFRIIAGASGSGGSCYFDHIIVRNWRSVEPALGSWGSEEAA